MILRKGYWCRGTVTGLGCPERVFVAARREGSLYFSIHNGSGGLMENYHPPMNANGVQ
jgi:hypothetical protein